MKVAKVFDTALSILIPAAAALMILAILAMLANKNTQKFEQDEEANKIFLEGSIFEEDPLLTKTVVCRRTYDHWDKLISETCDTWERPHEQRSTR